MQQTSNINRLPFRALPPALLSIFSIVALSLGLLGNRASAQDIIPLQLSNQSPLASIFGLPVAESPAILASGQETSHVSFDWASNFTNDFSNNELVYLDGESTQLNIRWRYGFDLWEFGVDVKYSRYSGGSLDNFIENWHSWFQLPNGGRENAVRNQLRYDYIRDGIQQLGITQNHSGFGDTRLTGAYQIKSNSRFDMAIRGGLKIPTGDSDKLFGSGGVDFNIAYTLGDSVSLQDYRSRYFAAVGLLLSQDGDVLPTFRKNTVAYYHAGLIRDLGESWQIKLQLDGHTAFYQSALPQLDAAMQLSIGASYRINQDLALDFAIAEDVITDSSSDVNFHIGLYNYF